MKLTVVKSETIKGRGPAPKRNYFGESSEDDVTDAGKAKKLRSPTTTVVSSSLESSPIAVLVGPQAVEIYVHEALLSFSSAYLKNALKPEWRDPHKNQIVLRDVDVMIFRIYVNWLYTGCFNIADDPTINPKTTSEGPAVINREWTTWSQCYELANFLQDSDCKDALVDMSIEKMISDHEYVVELPNLIYSTSQSQSPSRKLAVDMAVSVWSGDTIKSADQADYPAEFLVDVIKAGLRRGVSLPTGVQAFFKSKNTCVYHEHTLTKTPCYKVKRGV